jgi:hypothetical protein
MSCFLATWVMIESTVFPFSYCSSHFNISSPDTRRFDKSMYPIHQPRNASPPKCDSPLSLSTRMTTATSLRPTRMILLTDRIRLRDNSESKIIPSILSYSSYCQSRHDKGTYKFDIGSHLLNGDDLDHYEGVHLYVSFTDMSPDMVS